MADQKQNQETALSEGGDKSAAKQQTQTEAIASGNATRAEFGGKVVKRDKQETEAPSLRELGKQQALTVVDEDIYEEFTVDNIRRPLYRRLFSRGQVVPTDVYKAAMDGKSQVSAVVTDVSQQVGGAEGRVGGTVDPKGPAKAASQRG